MSQSASSSALRLPWLVPMRNLGACCFLSAVLQPAGGPVGLRVSIVVPGPQGAPENSNKGSQVNAGQGDHSPELP